MIDIAQDKIQGAIVGAAVGDALGVPVEFRPRFELERDPVVDMREFGSHGQPKGTWSDDTSMMLALIDSLSEKGFDIEDQGARYVNWAFLGQYHPHGVLFDIGSTTRYALQRIASGASAFQSGDVEEFSKGNGSLMRIAPLAIFLLDKSIEDRHRMSSEASAITHAHIDVRVACFIFCEFFRWMIIEKDLVTAWIMTQEVSMKFVVEQIGNNGRAKASLSLIQSWSKEDFLPANLEYQLISSTGYVWDTLLASIWCLMTTGSYSEAVLRAVNLGDDTDTTGCVTGILAGAYYGIDAIPQEWVQALASGSEGQYNVLEYANKMLIY